MTARPFIWCWLPTGSNYRTARRGTASTSWWVISDDLQGVREFLPEVVCDIFCRACEIDPCGSKWKITDKGEVSRDGKRVDDVPRELADFASEFGSLYS